MSTAGTRAVRSLFTHANNCLLHSHKHWLPQPQWEAFGVSTSCLNHINLLLWNTQHHWHISNVTLRLFHSRLMVIGLPEGTEFLLFPIMASHFPHLELGDKSPLQASTKVAVPNYGPEVPLALQMWVCFPAPNRPLHLRKGFLISCKVRRVVFIWLSRENTTCKSTQKYFHLFCTSFTTDIVTKELSRHLDSNSHRKKHEGTLREDTKEKSISCCSTTDS